MKDKLTGKKEDIDKMASLIFFLSKLTRKQIHCTIHKEKLYDLQTMA